ncbi:MAG: carboxypeptidase-like regulatory domain-containing protein, partial [Bacteroidota bacterium]
MYPLFLRRLSARALPTFLCLFTLTFAYGQGVVTGVVTESGGETLLAANVVVPGTSLGAITDLDGSYRLSLKAGTYTLQASYLGYDPTEEEITIADGQTIELDFTLSTAAIMGQEILVTAQMLGQRAAINRQLNADGIVNVISEEQIQELPDANAAEALGRLPGVSLKRAGGEANKVVLRGLNDKFALISLNGVPVPATDANARGVDLSMFSQSSLAGIEVTKAVTPDMDADAIAGAINLVTRKAPEEKELRIDVGGGYNALENSLGQYTFDAR